MKVKLHICYIYVGGLSDTFYLVGHSISESLWALVNQLCVSCGVLELPSSYSSFPPNTGVSNLHLLFGSQHTFPLAAR